MKKVLKCKTTGDIMNILKRFFMVNTASCLLVRKGMLVTTVENHVQTLSSVLLTCLMVGVGGSGFAKLNRSSVLRAQEGCRRLTVNV